MLLFMNEGALNISPLEYGYIDLSQFNRMSKTICMLLSLYLLLGDYLKMLKLLSRSKLFLFMVTVPY